VQKGGPSFLMARNPYAKPHATAHQRVAHLRSKGLIVPRPNVAARKIELIGYERLRIYFLSRRDLADPNRPFLANTDYRQILQLYDCDMKLRAACFDAIGQFELLFRNAISETLSSANGSHPYDDPKLFKDAQDHIDAVSTFLRVYNESKDQRAKHYRDKYSSPLLPPIWTMKEFLTFGQASRIYRCLDGSTKTKIAAQFGVPTDELFSGWVAALVDLRNMCAHHDRLFNRSFQKQPARLKRNNVPIAPPNKLRAILECLDYMMNFVGVPVAINAKVGQILEKYRSVIKPSEAGY
jgi:abortive infection bacteriophage resistance protein